MASRQESHAMQRKKAATLPLGTTRCSLPDAPEPPFVTLRIARMFCLGTWVLHTAVLIGLCYIEDGARQQKVVADQYASPRTAHVFCAFSFGLVVVLDLMVLRFAGRQVIQILSTLLLACDTTAFIAYTAMVVLQPLVVQGSFGLLFTARLSMWLFSSGCLVMFFNAVYASSRWTTLISLCLLYSTLISGYAWMLWGAFPAFLLSCGCFAALGIHMFAASRVRPEQHLLPEHGIRLAELFTLVTWVGFPVAALAQQQGWVSADTAEITTCLLDYSSKVSLVYVLVGINSEQLAVQKLLHVHESLTSTLSWFRMSNLISVHTESLNRIDADVGEWLSTEFRLAPFTPRVAPSWKSRKWRTSFEAKAKSSPTKAEVNVEDYLMLYEWDAINASPAECRAMLIAIFRSLNLIGDAFGFDEAALGRFIRVCENRYHNNPYHNWRHAVTVTHSLFLLLTASLEIKNWASPLDMLAALLSAIVHDLEHGGVNNTFHVHTASPLALEYNDRNVLENFHARTAFEILHKTQLLAALPEEDYAHVRKVMVECVLGTDMSVHNEALVRLRELNEMGGFYLHLDNDVVARTFAIRVLLHSADIYNPWKPFPIARAWAQLITQEFQGQVAQETEFGLEPTLPPAMLATSGPGFAKAQLGFIEMVLLPWWAEIVTLFQTDFGGIVGRLNDNHATWKEMAADLDEPAPAEGPGPDEGSTKKVA